MHFNGELLSVWRVWNAIGISRLPYLPKQNTTVTDTDAITTAGIYILPYGSQCLVWCRIKTRARRSRTLPPSISLLRDTVSQLIYSSKGLQSTRRFFLLCYYVNNYPVLLLTNILCV